ncbi:MAG: OmpH family outer membrane protein [Myxococcales bacterium]|nr:OmpH family outer membrane protein [Myxococcales bacterium]
MHRLLICAAALVGLASPAYANKICIVDFQTAVTSTKEGQSAQSKIDKMYSSRKGELERMQQELEKAIADFQSRAMILSADARAEEEQKLAQRQAAFQQTYMQAQTEMQETYMNLLGDLDKKMRKTASEVGQSSGCTVVLDKAVVVYQSSDVRDISTTLVQRYNQQHPGQ